MNDRQPTLWKATSAPPACNNIKPDW